MTRGKQTCRILKEIRRSIAEANDISLVISECSYQGDCTGTCPRCEAEVRFLEHQLRLRRLAGKAVVLAGLSTALAPLTGCTPQSASAPAIEVQQDSIEKFEFSRAITDESITVEPYNFKGVCTLAQAEAKPDVDSINRYIESHLIIPPSAVENKTNTRIVIEFIVDSTGTATQKRIVRPYSEEIDRQVLDIAETLPKIRPAVVKGIKVPCVFCVVINIKKLATPTDSTLSNTTQKWRPPMK